MRDLHPHLNITSVAHLLFMFIEHSGDKAINPQDTSRLLSNLTRTGVKGVNGEIGGPRGIRTLNTIFLRDRRLPIASCGQK